MGRQVGKVRYDIKGRKLPEGISQRSNGRYQIRITKDGKQHTEYTWNLAEAKEKLDTLKGELAKGSITNLTNYTLNEWYDEWLCTYKKSVLKQRTYNNYERYWDRYIRDSKLGKMRLNRIKQIDIVKLYKDLTECREKPLAHSTVVYINTMLGSALDQSVQNGLIPYNPSVGVMKHIKGKKAKERYALTQREEELFMEFIAEGRYKGYEPMFTVLFYTGIRSGELRALTWDDINFVNKTITINKSINYDYLDSQEGKKFYITTPKTESSIRIVPMLPVVEKALKQQKEWEELFNIDSSYEVPYFDDDKKEVKKCSGFVFTTSKGTITTDVSLNRTIRAIVKAYNAKETKEKGEKAIMLHNFTVHCTRHTFATQSYEKNMDSLCISGVLGHSSEQTTRSIYTHVKPNILQEKMFQAWS